MRVCHDEPGRLTFVVRERKTINAIFRDGTRRTIEVAAKKRLLRSRETESAGCHRFRIAWRLDEEFYGVGWYIVNVRARDALRPSGPEGEAWFTAD